MSSREELYSVSFAHLCGIRNFTVLVKNVDIVHLAQTCSALSAGLAPYISKNIVFEFRNNSLPSKFKYFQPKHILCDFNSYATYTPLLTTEERQGFLFEKERLEREWECRKYLHSCASYSRLGYLFELHFQHFPASLTHLTFGSNFNHIVHNLPTTITHLTFVGWYDAPVDYLPSSITHLTFGYHFNQNVDHLPHSLKSLVFGSCFNKPVNNLPVSLTTIVFGKFFNQDISKLPASIQHITLGPSFNHPVNILPQELTHLHLKFASLMGFDIPDGNRVLAGKNVKVTFEPK